MALGALIIACEAAWGERDRLRATLPLLGGTLLERQARQVAAAGAAEIAVLVGRVPPALVAAVDRLRREDIRVTVVRTLAEAADRFHPDEPLLLLADGVVIEQEWVARVAGATAPTLLVLPDLPEHALHERIDAGARWAGLALLTGAALRRTAAMLGDWDAQSTLLRGAVQDGAARLPVEGDAPARSPAVIERGEQLAPIEARLAAEQVPASSPHWPCRWLLAPLARAIVPRLVQRAAVDADLVAFAAPAVALVGAGAALGGWTLAGAALMLLGSGVAEVAVRLAGVRLLRLRRAATLGTLRRLFALAIPFAAAHDAMRADGQWGWWLVAAIGAGAAAALFPLRRRIGAGPTWAADADGLLVAFLLLALVAGSGASLAAIALYASATLLHAGRALIDRVPPHASV